MWIRKQYKACQGIALVLVISMVLPMVSYAFEPSRLPVSASQEKIFLKFFEDNQKAILNKIQNQTDTDEDGAMVWVYIDPRIPDVRFMMRQNDEQGFDLYAQEKKYAKKVIASEGYTRHIINRNQFVWVNKFQGHRIAIVDYKGSTPYLAKSELTSSNIDQNLLKARISHTSLNGTQYNQNGEVIFSPEAYKKQMEMQDRIQKFYAVADQCAAVVKGDDIRQRDLIRKVFAIQQPKGQYSDDQLEKFEDEIEIAKFAQIPLNVLSEKTLDVSLDTTIYTWMAFYELYFGKKTKEEWIKDFFDIEKYPERTWSSKKYQAAVGNMVAQFDIYRARKPIKTLSEKDKLLTIALFNNDISGLNKKCTEAHDERVKESQNVQMIPDARAMARVLDQIDDSLAKKYQDITNPYIEKIKKSPISALLGSEEFRDVIGSFDINDCVQDGEGVNEVSLENVNDAIDDISNMYREKISDVVSSYNDVFKASLLQTYIESFPKAVQVVLGQRLGTYEARVICGLIDDIYDSDAILRWRDRALMGIGFLGGLICGATGIGAPATVAITTGINLATIASGVEKWNQGNELEDQVSQALITGEIDQETGLSDIEKHESMQTEGAWDVAGTFALEGLGYAAGKTYRYLVVKKQIRTAKNFFTSEDAQLVQGVDRILNKPQYSPIDPEKALIILHKVATTGNTYEKTKGVFAHSFARQAAINEARAQLTALGYAEVDVNGLIDHLFGFENGMLTQRLNISRTSYPDGTTVEYNAKKIEKAKPDVNTQQVPASTSASPVKQYDSNSGRAKFVENEEGDWVRLAKPDIVPAHAIDIEVLKHREKALWDKVSQVEQYKEKIKNIKDTDDISLADAQDMQALILARNELQHQVSVANSNLVRGVQNLLEKYGIKSSIDESNDITSLIINLNSDHPINEKVRRYLRGITDHPENYFTYEYNPYSLRQMLAGGCIRNETHFVLGMSTIERMVTNDLGSLEFHEFRHLYHGVRRKNNLPSIYDQGFRSNQPDLINIQTYAKEYAAEEFDAYADEFKRVSRDLYWAMKETPRNLSRVMQSMSSMEHYRQTLEDFSKATLKNTKEAYEAIINEAYLDYIITNTEEISYITFRLRNGKTYIKTFASEQERALLTSLQESKKEFNSSDFISARSAMLKYLQGQLKELNRISYLQTIDLLRMKHEFYQIDAILNHDDLSGPYLTQLQSHVDRSLELSQKTWFRDYTNAEKAYGTTIKQAPESYFDKLWSDVIQEKGLDQAPQAELNNILTGVPVSTVSIHPGLKVLNIEESTALEIQAILDKFEYQMLDQEKAIHVLDDAKSTGNYEKAKEDLRRLWGYSEEDANVMVNKINSRHLESRSQIESHVELHGVTEELLFDVLEEIEKADEEISKLLKAKKTFQEDHALQESYLASKSEKFNPKILEFLDRQIQNIDNLLVPLNNHMIDLTQSLLSVQGIGTDILTNAMGHKQLKLFFTNDHPFHRTIERYLKEINQNANGDIEILSGQNLDFIFDPLELNITHTTAMVSQTRLTFGISTLNRILGNSLGSTEFHEIIHMYNNVRRHKGIPSKFYDQAFLNSGEELAKTSKEYAGYFSADEIRAYGDTFKREVENLVKDADGRMFLSAVSANLQIPLALTRTALKNTKDFFEAIAARVTTLKNGKIKYWREDNYRVIEIKLPDQRRYRKYFVTPEEVHLIDNWSVSGGTDHARLAVQIEKAIQADLVHLNALAYRELIDYQIFNTRVLEAKKMYVTQQYEGAFAQAYDQKLIEIKESSRLVYAHAKETHPEFSWTVKKLDDEHWAYVIQNDDPISISKINKQSVPADQMPKISHDLMWLKSRAIQNYPDLDVVKLDEAILEVQHILNKPGYKKISLLETMEILEEAHFTGESILIDGVMIAEYSKLRAAATARQKLRALGYSEEDAATIVSRLASNEVRMLGDAKTAF